MEGNKRITKGTNGDIIRTMSNDRLALLLICPNEMGFAEIPCCQSDECNCFNCLMDWLEEDATWEQE